MRRSCTLRRSVVGILFLGLSWNNNNNNNNGHQTVHSFLLPSGALQTKTPHHQHRGATATAIDRPVAAAATYTGCRVSLSWGALPELPKLPDMSKLPDLSKLPNPFGDGEAAAATSPALAASGGDDNDPVAAVAEPPPALTEIEIELLSRKMRDDIDIPYIPEFMEAEVLKVAITTVCQIAPVALPDGMFIDLMKGNVDWQDVQEDTINALNDNICIPIVSRDVQDELVKGVCMILFNPMTDAKHRRKMIGRTLQASLNQESDEDFAKMLNEMVDIPMVSEEQEYKMALKLAKSINAAFETLVPESMRELLQNNSSPEELQEARTNLVNRLNDMIDIPFQTEKQEEKQFKKIVDFLLMRYGLAEGTKPPEEELIYIARELAILEEEAEIQQALHEQKMSKFDRKKVDLENRRTVLESDQQQEEAEEATAAAAPEKDEDEVVPPFFAAQC